MTNKILLSAALSAAIVGTAGTSARADDPKIAGPDAFVRVLHAIPDGPKADAFIDGKRTLNDRLFGGISKYLRVRAGYHGFALRSNEPARTIVSGTSTLRRGDFYTLIAYGTPARPRFRLFNDSAGEVRFGQSRLTLFHLSPGTPAVQVVAFSKNGSILRLGRIKYGQVKAVTVPAAPMTIQLRHGDAIVKSIPGIHPRAGRKYAAYVMGRPGEDFLVNLDVTASQ